MNIKYMHLIIALLFVTPLLGAQEGSPSAPSAAISDMAITDMKGSVTGIEIGFALNATGLLLAGGPLLLPYNASPTAASIFTGIGLAPAGYITSTIAYSTLLENYNRLYPNDKQDMKPYLWLTLGGTAVASMAAILYVFELAHYAPNEKFFMVGQSEHPEIGSGYLVLSLAGVATHIAGMIVGSVHAETLLAKVKEDRQRGAVSIVSAPTSIGIYPEIGINYVGVYFSLP